MFTMFRGRQAIALGTICAAALAGCTSGRPAKEPPHFSRSLAVGNAMFPLRPGTEFVYRGSVTEAGKSAAHSVTFTVTDLTKMIGGVRTVVAWDRDFEAGEITEQELAFFAQDDRGNVWNFGEYPEEFADGKFQGAPDTWISGAGGAYGGVHMLARPAVGAKYREGLVPAIEFNDMSEVTAIGQKTCVPAGCFRRVLKVTEWSPNDPSSGHQLKYYAPAVGLVRVGARGGDAQEFLTLSAIRHLDGPQLAAVRSAALTMERRAYHVSKIYRETSRAFRRLRPLVS